MKRLLEVIACSVEDAEAAEQGGAGRLEVVRELGRGGCTPELALVRAILDRVSIPVRVMLRESDGFAYAGREEISRMCAFAREIASLPVDGLVLGFAAEGALDISTSAELLHSAPVLKATFHHAFDAAVDTFDALARIKALPNVDRVLTSAPRLSWRHLVEAAQPGLTIMAGGGMTGQRIPALARATPVAEFHVGRAASEPERPEGRVERLVRALECHGSIYFELALP
jgi:copper homeostasis protein